MLQHHSKKKSWIIWIILIKLLCKLGLLILLYLIKTERQLVTIQIGLDLKKAFKKLVIKKFIAPLFLVLVAHPMLSHTRLIN